MDDAIWILQCLRELFKRSESDVQQRLMTMLPPAWGRDRIADWFDGTGHKARQSIQLREMNGILSLPTDRRGNNPLEEQVAMLVQEFYVDDEISIETSYKKQVVHPSPSRNPVPLRFLHLTIRETYERFKSKYPTVDIKRTKFFELRPPWVKEKTPHESCLCIYHENAGLLLQVRLAR